MLNVYTLKDANKWDEIVKTFKDYDVYYLSGYTKAFYLHGDGQPLLFHYEDNDIKAINVVMKRDISNDVHFSNLEKDKYYDFATPYGYGGWLIEGEGKLDNLFNEYKQWCKENNIVSEFTRFHPIISNQNNVRNIYKVVDLGNTVSINLNSEEYIWDNFTSKNRNVIRKAIKNGVQIKEAFDADILKVFKDIYNQTMNRDEADEYYYFNDEFYNSILNDLNKEATVFYAEYNNKIIMASIILKSNEKLSYHLSGSLKEYGSLAATNLLLFEVAKWGSKNGYKTLHLGGGVGAKEDSLYSFKKAFNKNEPINYCLGEMIFDEDKYNELVSMRKDEIKGSFIPLYRAK